MNKGNVGTSECLNVFMETFEACYMMMFLLGNGRFPKPVKTSEN